MPRLRCLGCSRLTTSTRCPACAGRLKALRNAEAATARAVVATAWATGAPCGLCGKPFTSADPPTGGHADRPFIRGGAGGRLVAQHRSCNSAQGARH